MQDVNPLRKLGHIEDSMLNGGMDAQLENTRPYRSHRLPIIRFETLLNLVQLMPGLSPRVSREGS